MAPYPSRELRAAVLGLAGLPGRRSAPPRGGHDDGLGRGTVEPGVAVNLGGHDGADG